jgi:hypothetical protein
VHGRPRLTAPRLAALLALVATLATAAFLLSRHRPVEVAVPAAGADPGCATMAGALPSRLLSQERVATSQTSPAVAAWGRPAIIWRCGVEPPAPTTQDCITVNGIDWLVQPLDDGTGFVTYGRTPAVQVLVPKEYAPETFALPALSTAVSQVEQGEHHCT